MRTTIVIPLRRQKDEWLSTCVRSALAQSVATDVTVVSAADTPDSNLAVLAGLTSERLRVLRSAPEDGFAARINLGFFSASSERVSLLLSDDWLEPDAVEKSLRHHEDIVSTGFRAFDATGEQILWERRLDREGYGALTTDEARASYLTHFFTFQASAIRAMGGVDPEVGLTGADDYDMIWTLLERGATVRVLEECLYNYRDHAGERLTCRAREDQLRDMAKILRKHRLSEEEQATILLRKAKWFGQPYHVVIEDSKRSEAKSTALSS